MDFIIQFFAKILDDHSKFVASGSQAAVMIAAIGLLLTALSIYISRKSAKGGEKKNKRDEFLNHLNPLREAHTRELENVIRYLDEIDTKGNQSGGQWFTELCEKNNHKEAVLYLRANKYITTYLSVLMSLLKYIDEDFYQSKNHGVEKKKLIDRIRDEIRRDVLFLVALNSSYLDSTNGDNRYAYFQELLNKFNFFEYTNFMEACLNPSQISKLGRGTPAEEIERYLRSIVISTRERFDCIFRFESRNRRADSYTLPLSFILSCIYRNPFKEECMNTLAKLPEQVRKTIEEVRAEKISECEKQLQIGFMFIDFIGRYLVVVSPNRREEIEQTEKITVEEMDAGEKVSVEFIAQLLREGYLKDEEKLVNSFFCYKSKDGIIGYHDYSRFKKQLITYSNWMAHCDKLKSDKFNTDIEEELKYWDNEIKAIIVQRAGKKPGISDKVKHAVKRFIFRKDGSVSNN